MSDSRYSIVKELTEKKLELLDALNQSDNEASRYDVEALELIEGIEAYKKNALEKVEEEIKSLNDRASRLKVKAAALRDNKASKEKAVKAKIEAIDVALKDLKEISQLSLKQEDEKK
jgi:Fe2+ transport system protein B